VSSLGTDDGSLSEEIQSKTLRIETAWHTSNLICLHLFNVHAESNCFTHRLYK